MICFINYRIVLLIFGNAKYTISVDRILFYSKSQMSDDAHTQTLQKVHGLLQLIDHFKRLVWARMFSVHLLEDED